MGKGYAMGKLLWFVSGAASVLAVASAAPGAVLTGPVTNPANGHQYYLLENANWTGSEAEAVRLGGHLATVRNAAENQWIFQTFAEGSNRSLWIGLNDAAVEGQFRWTSGEPVTYTNWDTGTNQPDNLNPDHYVMLWPPNAPFGGTSATWNDMPNAGQWYGLNLYGVAEVVPEPGTLTALGLAGAGLLMRRRRDRARPHAPGWCLHHHRR